MKVPRKIFGNWKHKKTGGVYITIGEAKLQTAEPIGDMTELVVYMATDATLWVRPKDEFLDGRFKEIKRK